MEYLEDVDELIALAWSAEESLLTPTTRGDRNHVASLLALDFYEIGQSGRRWSAAEVIEELAATGTSDLGEFSITEREAKLVSDEVVLPSYRLSTGSRTSRRSALWRQTGSSVQCFFHQGTTLPDR